MISGSNTYFCSMKEKKHIVTSLYESPFGMLLLGSFGERLCLCDWHTEHHRDKISGRLQRILNARLEEETSPVIEKASSELDEYFAGKRKAFDIPLLFTGTEFQKAVWQALLDIPYGNTISYKEQAMRIGKPTAIRAVANANGANPISLFAPCHRVVGSDNSLTGYGGGIKIKEYLLNLENQHRDDADALFSAAIK